MLVFERINDVMVYLRKARKEGKTVGFVPTMGALHQGHIALIKASRKENDLTVCSIFINPTQFNDKNDFDKYPVTLAPDAEKLKKAKCDVLFLPSVMEMYPDGLDDNTVPDFGFTTATLEGEHRPGHFKGVIQIVEKLLRIVQPHKLYMGQKDYQQQLIIQHLIKRKRFKTQLVTVATLREKDGLAMSSRNVRLDKRSRKLAVEISKTLKEVKAATRRVASTIEQLQTWGLARLADFKGIEPEYFEIRNAETLKPAKAKTEKLVAITAVKIGGVRLIDNMLLN